MAAIAAIVDHLTGVLAVTADRPTEAHPLEDLMVAVDAVIRRRHRMVQVLLGDRMAARDHTAASAADLTAVPGVGRMGAEVLTGAITNT